MENKVVTISKEEVRYDDYENMFFKDMEGNEYKIGKKRDQEVFDTIVANPGRAVELIYARYLNKDYINDVKLFEGKAPVKPMEAELGEKPKMQAYAHEADPTKHIPGEQIGMTVYEIGHMTRAKLLKAIFGVDAANELITWYRGQILGTTRVPFDGADLPKVYKEP